ncbi:hypothetical protein [Shewanella sedimentimangrovi]|uniref:Uncharacterized protein n=1 Tax=Shewanella sedimentimangrovi TaxID=2814293 RepID=A0ABX7QZ64_9GAMM|nr:hypothetical protein [Shewanella sedimentimangrovi]QSX36265.1 hypothetical protein JYB85_13170 [Shewanella sedimentimangrovi]
MGLAPILQAVSKTAFAGNFHQRQIIGIFPMAGQSKYTSENHSQGKELLNFR